MTQEANILPADKLAGDKLRARRVVLGMSQAELGSAMGDISFQQIQKYEKGINGMRASRIQQAAEILDVKPSYFFDEDDGYVQPTKLEVSIMRDVSKITDPRHKAFLRIFIKFLVRG